MLIILSRLSPEKNQQLLLDAIGEWERGPDYSPIHALICGGAAYMQGKQHEKQRCFSAADLYVFPTSHESYGLPALTLDNAAMRPAFGAVATKATFLKELQTLTGSNLAAKGRAAQEFARQQPFAVTAARLAEILTGLQSN